MFITWIGQSGYVIRTGTAEIIIDPYLSDVVNRVAKRPRLVEAPIQPSDIRADAIICTHNHLDHLDVDAVVEMDRGLNFITTFEGKEKLQELGFSKVNALRVGDTITVGDIEIVAVYAKHTVEAFGVVIRAEGHTLYFSGDTLFDERLFLVAEYRPDIAFICINGKLGNMNVDEAVVTANNIGAQVNVPNHYGMFASNTENPKLFTDQIKNGFVMEFNKEYSISQMIPDGLEIKEYNGPGYKEQVDFNNWRVAIANYKPELEESKLQYMERHLESDEVFVLVEGTAGLIIGKEKTRCLFEKGKLYNVKCGTWHRVFMKENSKIVIVENADTGIDNTEYMNI